MKLHRTTGRPDWESIEPTKRNSWQSLAASTHGLVTPGNLITMLGLAIVIYALAMLLEGHLWSAVIGLAAGRALDVADGLAADATGTKSPLGEAMDATVDKIGTFLTLLVAAVSGAVSWWLVGGLALPHLIISVIVFFSLSRGRKFHPSRLGKLSMGAAWVGLLSLVALRASGLPTGSIPGLLAYGLSFLSILMGLYATLGYLREQVK